MEAKDCMPGAKVRYWPVRGGRESYVGTVRLEPWALGDGSLVTHLKDLDRPAKPYVHAAFVEWLELVEPAPIEEAGT